MKAVATGFLLGAAVVYLVAKANEDHAAVGRVRPGRGRGGDGRRAGRLVRRHRAVPPPARHPGPAHGDHPEAQGPDRAQPRRVRRAELPHRRGPDRPAARAPGSAPDWAAGWPSRATPSGPPTPSPTASAGTIEVIDDRDVSGRARRRRRPAAAHDRGRAARSARRSTSPSTAATTSDLLDALLVGLGTFLDENRGTFRRRLDSESPWWVPESIDDRIFERMYSAVHRFLIDIGQRRRPRGAPGDRRADPPPRRPAAHRPGAHRQGRGDQARAARPPRRAGVDRRRCGWRSRSRSSTAAGDPDSELRRRLAVAAAPGSASGWQSDPELQAKVDDWVERAAVLRRRELPQRGVRDHRHHGRALGRRRHVPAHRAAGRPRPPVHPHQRHRRRRPGRRA